MTHLDPLGLLQEAGADGHQGVFRPLVEPVDGRAVDHGRELPRPHAQDGAHGGEAQDHLDAGHSGATQGAGGAGADRAEAHRAKAHRHHWAGRSRSQKRSAWSRVPKSGERVLASGSEAWASTEVGAGVGPTLPEWPRKGGPSGDGSPSGRRRRLRTGRATSLEQVWSPGTQSLLRAPEDGG